MRSTRASDQMRRRDVLLLRPTPRVRVYDLACHRLYMQYVDARRGRPASPRLDESRLGEPDAVFDTRDPHEIFESLAAELDKADVLRVRGGEWLADPGLRQEVDRVIAAFTARGGRVEFEGG